MVKVKICGITNLEDALAAFFSGAHALGFVFYKKSKRYLEPKKAGNISRILPRGIIKVGVFVDEKEDKIRKIPKICALDMLQFHGNESPEFCSRFKGYKVIKAFRVNNGLSLEGIKKYKTFAFLFDTFSSSVAGGSGKKFDWNLLKKIGRINRPVFLSGGLNSSNIKRAIKLIGPDWVDFSSSVEVKPGIKSHKKIKDIMRKVK